MNLIFLKFVGSFSVFLDISQGFFRRFSEGFHLLLFFMLSLETSGSALTFFYEFRDFWVLFDLTIFPLDSFRRFVFRFGLI